MKDLLKTTAKASMRPCPEIKPSFIAVRKSDGFTFSPYGSIPWPSEIKANGFVYYDRRENIFFGNRFSSEESARKTWNYRQLRNAVKFLRELRKMGKAQRNDLVSWYLKINIDNLDGS